MRLPPVPKDLKEQSAIQAWFTEWMKTSAGKEYLNASQESYTVTVKTNGSFSADGLKPGKFIFTASIHSRSGIPSSRTEVLASVSKEFELKAPGNPDDASPHDLGKLELRLHRNLKVATVLRSSASKLWTANRSNCRTSRASSCCWISGRPGAALAWRSCHR